MSGPDLLLLLQLSHHSYLQHILEEVIHTSTVIEMCSICILPTNIKLL